MRRRSERKKSSSPAPVPVARRSRRSRKVSENEKTEDETIGQKDNADTDNTGQAQLAHASAARSEEINEGRASSEERAGSGSSPVRKSRGSRTTPKKRTEAKGGDKNKVVDTIPEEEPENGQDVGKDSVQEEEKDLEPSATGHESESEKLAKTEDEPAPVEESLPEPTVAKDTEKEDEKTQQDDQAAEDDSSKQEVKVPSPSSKDEEHLKTSSDVLDIQTEEVEERDEEAPAPAERRESKRKHKEQKQEQQEEEEQKENRKQQEEKPEQIQDEPADLPNDKHETSVNSSASNTTTAPVLQQQRSVRKRKWLTNKKSSDRAPPVLAISTDSLKNIIADVVQPVSLSDVQLESSSEEEGLVTSDRESERSGSPMPASEARKERESEVNTATTCETGGEASTNKEGAGNTGWTTPTPATDTVPPQGGQSKATAATAAPHIVRSPSPARNRASHVLYITNLVRPFTVLQLKGLLARTGKIVEEDGFWIDRIKSKCFVAYSTEDEAIETRHALHGVRWPVSNPKCLNVDFGSRTDMDRAILSTKDEAPRYGQENTRDNQQSGNAWSRLEPSDKKPVRPVREWDVGKKEPSDHDKTNNDRRRGSKDGLDSRSRDADRPGQERKRSRDKEGRGRDRERERERNDRNTHARSRSGSPVPKTKRKENEPPIRLLDDLFRKTKGTPCIYWLPLTPEAIAEKEAYRQKRIEEHKLRIKEREDRQKEREKDRDRQRDTRRNRSNERRRSRSRERERRRY
ncbi:apoptotic chromatin condensation inducer in the nucleus [Drosophila rhopaloa]|uniref:Apoptotic chromatin condensation inducer in the nucleus n=1 Tax=Drosophila rhopaloa TaxID=1041015 RepID=A0A6P4EL84_DRORH|nr:apoptotic chromatin condensation inducer in the nucleus [Drosophila rhopaloa]